MAAAQVAQPADAAAADEPEAGSPPAPPRRRRLVLRWVALALLVLVGLACWVAWRGFQAATALADLQAELRPLAAQVQDGDLDALRAAAPALAEHDARAYEATTDPVWRAATHLPVVGTQLAAVSTVSAAVHDVVAGALPHLLESADALSPEQLRPEDGRVDLAPLVAAEPAMGAAAADVATAAGRLAALEDEDLWPLLADRVAPASEQVAELSDRLDDLHTALVAVPPALGADGPRSYLVLVLNPAELRSAGGIVGTLLELSADDGEVRLTDQRPAQFLDLPDEPTAEATEAELALHGKGLVGTMQSVTATPDFPRTAQVAAGLWQEATGRSVDGVLAVDPVGLAYLLRATGPLDGPDGVRLTSSNVVEELLAKTYARYPHAAQTDAFFAEVASQVSDAVLAGGFGAGDLVDALGRATADGRVAVWASDGRVADALAGTAVDHGFLSGGEGEALGVFLNDTTVSKMDYYLEPELTAGPLTCSATGPAAGTVRLDLRSTAPLDAATSLPTYVTGGGDPRGTIGTQVLVYSPAGGEIRQLTLTLPGQDPVLVGGELVDVGGGRTATAVQVTLAPGEEATLDVDVATADGVTTLPVVTTPTIHTGRLGPVATCG